MVQINHRQRALELKKQAMEFRSYGNGITDGRIQLISSNGFHDRFEYAEKCYALAERFETEAIQEMHRALIFEQET